MSPSRIALVACALLLPAAAHAQPVNAVLNTPYVFTTVDSYDMRGSTLSVAVTGVLQGEQEPSTIVFRYSTSTSSSYENARTFERCERFALLVMNKPGQYLLEVRQEYGSPLLMGCKLTRL